MTGGIPVTFDGCKIELLLWKTVTCRVTTNASSYLIFGASTGIHTAQQCHVIYRLRLAVVVKEMTQLSLSLTWKNLTTFAPVRTLGITGTPVITLLFQNHGARSQIADDPRLRMPRTACAKVYYFILCRTSTPLSR